MQKNTVLTVPATPVAMPAVAAAAAACFSQMDVGGHWRPGACVVALATVLVVERRSAPPTEAAMAQTTPAALAAPAVRRRCRLHRVLAPLASAAPAAWRSSSPRLAANARSPW